MKAKTLAKKVQYIVRFSQREIEICQSRNILFIKQSNIRSGSMRSHLNPGSKLLDPKKDKTSKSHKRKELLSIKDFEGTERFDTRAYLINQENVGEAILDCLINNDPEGVVEVINIYLRALNKKSFFQSN